MQIPYVIIKKGDEAQALFIGQIIRFDKADDGGTDVLMVDGDTIELDIDFDSFCGMVNSATAVTP